MIRLPRGGGFRLALILAAAAGGAGAAPADGPILWRTDYGLACKEAQEKGVPLFVEVGTDACFYCRKQEATTFTDPAVVRLVNSKFVPLRVDAHRDPAFAEALRVKVYPTTVIAAPGGKILVYHEGYLSAELLQEKARPVLPPEAKGD